MNYVYAQTEQCRFWFENSDPIGYMFDDFETWAQRTGHQTALLELQYLDEDTSRFVTRCIEHADLVLLFIPEFIDDSWCQKFDRPNVVFFLAGKLNWQPRHARVAECMYFFWSTCDFYKTYPNLLDIVPNQQRYFDVMLGRQKPHRTEIYNNIDHDKNIVTYFPSTNDGDIRSYGANNFVWPVDVLGKPNNEINFTVQEVTVNGVIVSLSQIIPRDIYGQTYYSLVAETQNENSFSFFTEKIVKPILAKRLFLVASGQYYLQNLKTYGFKTFGSVIDESYDLEPNDDVRMKMLLDQVNQLHNMDPATVLNQIKPIVEHNYKVMFNTDWQQRMINQIKNLM